MWKVAQKSYAPQSDAANAKPRTSGDVWIACNVKFDEAWTSASIEFTGPICKCETRSARAQGCL